jgi:hypothetical protein
MNGRNIPFVKYLGVIFDKRIAWRLHIKMTEAKVFRTFIIIYSIFKSERLSTNMKLTFYKALIRSEITYACPSSELPADAYLLKSQHLQNKVLRTSGNFPRVVHTGSRFAHGVQPSICIRSYNKIVQATSRSHTKSRE